jgi:hypothetical protein
MDECVAPTVALQAQHQLAVDIVELEGHPPAVTDRHGQRSP